jgi:ABC-type glycerol-3-phosphate transport system substrate-binding protein
LRIDFFFIFDIQKIESMMKKISGLLLVALVILIAACNKQKTDAKELTGTWHVYKYLYQNADETAQWLLANPLYTITFTSNGTFVEKDGAQIHDTVIGGVTYADTVYSGTNSGTYAFANNYTHLILTDSITVLQDSVLVRIPAQRNYTMFDLSGSNVQLDSANTSEYYLIKNM